MKKIVVLICLLFAFTACSFAAEPLKLTMGTGGTAGTYYPYGGAISQLVSDKTGLVSITAQATGAAIENIRLLDLGDIDIAIVQNDSAHYAYNGTEAFKDAKITSFKAIARLYPEVIHVVTGADSGIKTIEDFKGKKISVGAPGSGNESNARQILEVLGVGYETFTPLFISYAETANNFKDRQVDAFMYTTGVPNPSLMDISTLQKLSFIPIEGETRDKIMEAYPFFAKYAFPVNAYSGIDAPVETIAVQSILVVHEDLSEDIVYAMTKALFENKEELSTAHAKGKELDINLARNGVTIPFHPGAEKYFQEVGLK
ncbi:MAG: TAXI family TRAP transporter solute-binding subunit [Synergistaceae bacterium]|nr:TAXI family TRAP transporter solute-binding subunit [Synergistaceae bacterium]